MNESVIAELAPTGTLRAAINMGNFLLVTGTAASGEPEGVAPDMARAIAERLGVPVGYVPYPSPGELVDDAGTNKWDIALVGAEPAREKLLTFTAAYAEIEATYIVPATSPFTAADEVDRSGVRIIVRERAAYGLYLARSIKNAELIVTGTYEEARDRFQSENLDALAGLRSGLLGDAATMSGVRVLDGGFTSVQQAVGTLKQNQAGVAFLREFIEEAKSTGVVAGLIERHRVRGLTVAPPG